jgi:hypothetical protein
MGSLRQPRSLLPQTHANDAKYSSPWGTSTWMCGMAIYLIQIKSKPRSDDLRAVGCSKQRPYSAREVMETSMVDSGKMQLVSDMQNL